MNKARLIKRNEVIERKASPKPQAAVSIGKTVNVIKDWLQTRNQTTKPSAREAFANLFAPPQENCTEC